MTSIALHSAPARSTVFREQLRSVFLALRGETMLFTGALAVLTTLVVIAVLRSTPSPHERMGLSYGLGATVPVALMALLIPFGVWRTEDPSRREYHWAMPVARGPHTLLKLVCGWLWMMSAVALYIVWIVLVDLLIHAIRGYSGGMEWAAAWQWLVPFTAATITYLIASIAVIASDHPWRWILGSTVGFYVLVGFLRALNMTDAMRALLTLVDGFYGLAVTAFAAVSAHDPSSVERWIGATLIWGAVSLCGVTLASYRRKA
ncbi:MAG TPA: hypothetical protein VGT98_13735 [Candidatus Elarobacter sp.]|nr:hypothetical protein [Candidatus Elarobacter sp.]